MLDRLRAWRDRWRRPTANDRLDSWKEIATYLKRGVRTAQRWEKEEGLPVHRHDHENGASVYAHRSELDAWWHEYRNQLNNSKLNDNPWHRWSLAGAAALGVALVAAGVFFLLQPAPQPVPPVSGEKPSVAVLFFDNLSGESSLDWLRVGLAEMLVTALSQSEQIEVVGTETLHRILTEMGQPEGQGSAPEIAQRVADRTGVEMVLSGSFMKAGEELRIDVRLREAQSGKLIATSKVEGAGESSLFRMVDELGHRIRERLDVGPMGVHASRDLEEITTASIEAYRFYVEGVRLQRERKFQEAIPLFEKAVETDPDFAMALTRLSRLHGWFGRSSESEEYLNRALEHLDRLTLPERYYIEGYLHARKGIEGWSDEIETYEKLLEIDPDFSTARFQLALTYAFFGMTDKVVEHTDALRLRAYPDPQTYGMYARAHGTLGRFEPGYQAVQEYVRRTMDPSAVYWGYLTLGNHLTFWGRYSEAMEALETAEELRPELLEPQTSRWMIQVLREDWQGADVAADHVRASSDPGWKWQGWARKAINALYTGHSAESLELLTRAVGAHPRGKSTTDVLTAYVLLESGLAEPALKRAGAARTASGNLPEWEGLYYEALAQARLQQMEEAETTAEELRRQTELLPGPRWIRRYGHHLPGEIALARGDTSMAIQELTEAESLLTERGTGGAGRSFPWGISQHVPIWFALANAHLAAGDKDEAARWFERIADSTTEHVVWPIPYIRSFYFLGSIYEDRGNLARAHQYYQRFVDFWKGGDLDRQRIEEAEMKLASIEGSNTKLTQSRRP